MSMPDTPQAASADTLEAAPKIDPERLALRASPRPVVRLNRRMLALAAGTLAAAVLGGTLWSLQPHRRERSPATELYNVDRVSKAESLDQLPQDYSKLSVPATPVVTAAPVLGEPLPGDLGPAIVHAERNANIGTDAYGSPAQVDQLARVRDAEEAARSPVFFRSSGAGKAAPAATVTTVGAATPEPVSGNQPFNPMMPATSPAPPADPTAVQNRQAQKEAFVAKAGQSDVGTTRNPGSLQLPASPYQVMAGTIISAALVTGINSDLPGQVIANVTEAVYDTATGRHLLIPQGSRLIGRYDSQVAFGQRRVLLVWTRLILPDTSSVALDKLPGIDPAGYAGLEDGVDWHWDRLLAGAALSTLLGVSSELATSNSGTSSGNVVIATRNSAQDTVNQVGQEITRRNLSIQPTLTIRPGFPVRVMVNQDMVLRVYQPLFFEVGVAQ